MMTKQAHEILPGILRATVLIFREELCIFFLEHYGFGHATVFWHKIWVTLVSIQPFQKHLSIDFFVISSCCPNGTCTFGILKGPGTNPFAVTNVDPNFLSGWVFILWTSNFLCLAPPAMCNQPLPHTLAEIFTAFFQQAQIPPPKTRGFFQWTLEEQFARSGEVWEKPTAYRLNSPFQSPRTDPTSPKTTETHHQCSIIFMWINLPKGMFCKGKVSPKGHNPIKDKTTRNVSYWLSHHSLAVKEPPLCPAISAWSSQENNASLMAKPSSWKGRGIKVNLLYIGSEE